MVIMERVTNHHFERMTRNTREIAILHFQLISWSIWFVVLFNLLSDLTFSNSTFLLVKWQLAMVFRNMNIHQYWQGQAYTQLWGFPPSVTRPFGDLQVHCVSPFLFYLNDYEDGHQLLWCEDWGRRRPPASLCRQLKDVKKEGDDKSDRCLFSSQEGSISLAVGFATLINSLHICDPFLIIQRW